MSYHSDDPKKKLVIVISDPLGEICRLTDVIDKLQAELTMSKSQLAQTQRLEQQSRVETETIREATKSRDERLRDLQVQRVVYQRQHFFEKNNICQRAFF